MRNSACWNPFANWDPWPLTRLLLVLATLGLWTHLRLGWALPTLPGLARAAFGLFEIFCLFALVGLSHLYLIVLALPAYMTILLNDWLYALSYWTFRTALRLLYMRRVSAFAALLGEIALFIGCGFIIETIVRRYLPI